MSTIRKECKKCGVEKPLDSDHYHRSISSPTGFAYTCKDCVSTSKSNRRDRVKREREDDAGDAQARHDDPFASLRPEDFDVTVGNDGRIDPSASHEKRQEFSRSMGEVLSEVSDVATRGADGGDLLDALSDKSVRYIAALSEQEKRFGNRRHARSFSLAVAHEAMSMHMMKDVADRYFTGRIETKGWAADPRARKPTKRTVCLLLSDLHFGADLGELDEPMPYRAIEEARRFEYVIRQAADYKPQYRDVSELLIMFDGDNIQGMLLHDMRDGIPVIEQKAVFWEYTCAALGYLASAYPKVRVVCQPGNHGRDKLRHPGRATSSKWDGHEWGMYYALSKMCQSLKNVEFSTPFRAVSVIDLYGSKLLLTHGDTEVKIGHPLKAAEKNASVMDNINSTQRYGCTFDAAAFGHWHYGVYVPAAVKLIHNGALVPPDGFSRSLGANYATCGQFLWEAVEGFPVGDVRYITVGESQDHDDKLGTIIKPFRFQAEA